MSKLPEDFGPVWCGWRTLYGHDAAGQWSRYMFRLRVGRLRFHVFYRGDADADPHSHPWDFWTFPLTPYVEEVTAPLAGTMPGYEPTKYERKLNIVPAFRLSYRPASYLHRVLGRFGGRITVKGVGEGLFYSKKPIVTVVFTGKKAAKWGFLKLCGALGEFMNYKKYVEEGGKTAPCADETKANQGTSK